MKTLPFKKRVLGNKATQRLVDRKVTQTLRGNDAPQLDHGDMVRVTLDELLVGYVAISFQDMVTFDKLDIRDANRGGFDNRLELGSALRRAGFRFRPIHLYQLHRIQFQWRDWEEAGVDEPVVATAAAGVG